MSAASRPFHMLRTWGGHAGGDLPTLFWVFLPGFYRRSRRIRAAPASFYWRRGTPATLFLPIREFQFSSVRKDAGAVQRGQTSLCWYPGGPRRALVPPTPSHPSQPAFSCLLLCPFYILPLAHHTETLSRRTSSRCVMMDLKSLDILALVYMPTWQIQLRGG